MTLIRQAIREFQDHGCGTVAAALAFFTVFSLPALLMIAVYIAGSVFGEEAAQREINRQLGAALSPQVAGQVEELLENVSSNPQRGIVGTLIALAAILLAATKASVELKRVLNYALKVERVETGLRGYALKRISGFFMIVAISVILLASMTAGTIVLAFSQTLSGSLPLLYIWHLIAPGVTLILLAAAVFKILPDAKMEWQDVWFGAVLTGTLLVTSKYLLSLYFARSTVASAFGAAGSFALILLWLYFSSAVLLFGAELTQVRARRHGRQPQPVDGAVPLDDTNQPAA